MTLPMKITGTARFRKSQRKVRSPLLPGDLGLLRQIETQRAQARNDRSVEPLEYTGPLKNFGPILSNTNGHSSEIDFGKTSAFDVGLVIRSIINRMFADYPLKDSGSYLLSAKVMSETEEFRTAVPHVVTLNQLYGVFPHNTTKVDQAISELTSQDKIKMIPVSSTDGSMDIVIESESFYEMCDSVDANLEQLCRSRPDSTWFDISDLAEAGVDISESLKKGALVVDPKKPGVHCLAVPQQGRFLKLVRNARTWLIKAIIQYNSKFKEIPESLLLDKLTEAKRYWQHLRGVNLDWILYDAIGGGWVDGFQTPIDRGWKLLKK